MYMQISTMGKQSIQDLNRIINLGLNREKIFAIALGYCISNTLDVPNQNVESALDYFRLQSERDVMRLISSVNELTPCEVSTTLDHVKRFFSFRVDVAHCKNIPVIPIECCGPMTPFMALFRVANYFPNETITLINEEASKFIMSLGLLQNILKDLRKVNTETHVENTIQQTSVFDQK